MENNEICNVETGWEFDLASCGIGAAIGATIGGGLGLFFGGRAAKKLATKADERSAKAEKDIEELKKLLDVKTAPAAEKA